MIVSADTLINVLLLYIEFSHYHCNLTTVTNRLHYQYSVTNFHLSHQLTNSYPSIVKTEFSYLRQDDAGSVSSLKEINQNANLNFAPEQHEALLALVQQSTAQTSHSVNQLAYQLRILIEIADEKLQPAGAGYSITNPSESRYWILDKGSTDHICHSLVRVPII